MDEPWVKRFVSRKSDGPAKYEVFDYLSAEVVCFVPLLDWSERIALELNYGHVSAPMPTNRKENNLDTAK